MTITVQDRINAPRERVWAIITDIDNAADNFSAILSVEVLERPVEGIIGFKWRETRVMFGKEATETMWVTAEEPGRSYVVRAENHGMIYTTRLSVEDADDGVILESLFSAEATTFAARLMSLIGVLFNSVVRKAFQADHEDVRALVEAA